MFGLKARHVIARVKSSKTLTPSSILHLSRHCFSEGGFSNLTLLALRYSPSKENEPHPP